MLHSHKVKSTTLHLVGGKRSRATNVHEDTNFALGLRILQDAPKSFEKFIGANPYIIDGLLKFGSKSKIFTMENLPDIAMDVGLRLVENRAISVGTLQQVSDAMHTALRSEFGDSKEVRKKRENEFATTVQLAIRRAEERAMQMNDARKRCSVFGYAFGALHAGIQSYTGYIQKRQTNVNQTIAQQIISVVTIATAIPTLFTSHMGGLIISLGTIMIDVAAKMAVDSAVNRILPPTVWFEKYHRAVNRYLLDLDRFAEEDTTEHDNMKAFIQTTRAALTSCQPPPVLMHRSPVDHRLHSWLGF